MFCEVIYKDTAAFMFSDIFYYGTSVLKMIIILNASADFYDRALLYFTLFNVFKGA
jgi:hypothetical protein